jgi:hypothetical protein
VHGGNHQPVERTKSQPIDLVAHDALDRVDAGDEALGEQPRGARAVHARDLVVVVVERGGDVCRGAPGLAPARGPSSSTTTRRPARASS